MFTQSKSAEATSSARLEQAHVLGQWLIGRCRRDDQRQRTMPICVKGGIGARSSGGDLS